jgi:hypothetical protein
MRIRLAFLLVALLGVTAFAPAPLPRRSRQAADVVSLVRMTGNWEVVSMGCYGPDKQIAYHITAWKEIRIQDGKWSFCSEEGKPSHTFGLAIGGNKQPATIDFLGGDKQVSMAGVARFRGGVLEVLYQTSPLPRDRLVQFENPPHGFYLFTLKKK